MSALAHPHRPTAGSHGSVHTARRLARLTSMAAATTLALGLLLGGCDNGATAASAAPTAPNASVAGGTALDVPARGQEADVAAVAAAFDAAWNAADPAALAALYAEDAEFVNIIGGIITGAAAIRAQHAFLFAGPFRGSHAASAVRRITFLTGTIAVLDVDAQLTGYVALSPGIRATEPGVLRARFKHLVVKRGGVWQILSSQSTAVQPAM